MTDTIRQNCAEYRFTASATRKKLLQIPEEEEFFVAVSMQDVTELNAYIRENEEQRMIAGLIYIDNYDEVMESVEEVRQSLLVALSDEDQ